MSAHDFIEVKDRRWCTCCNLFQSKSPTAAFFPTPRKLCPRDTPHARSLNEKSSQIPSTSLCAHGNEPATCTVCHMWEQVASTRHLEGCQSGDFGPCDCQVVPSKNRGADQ